MTKEQAQAYYDRFHAFGELSDEKLEISTLGLLHKGRS